MRRVGLHSHCSTLAALLLTALSTVCVTPPFVNAQSAATILHLSNLDDPFAWLEEIRGKKQLAWVREQNERTLNQLSRNPRYQQYYDSALAIRRAGRLIPGVSGNSHDGWVYDLLQDDKHGRGLWRRAKLASYLSARTEWQPLLDIDALVQREGKLWVFNSAKCFGNRCLVGMDRGEGVEWREFNVDAADFVKDGFVIPESARNFVVWRDASTLLVSHGNEIKKWSRGTSYSSAQEILRSKKDEIAAVWDYVGESERIIVAERSDRRNRNREIYKLEPDDRLTPISAHLESVSVVGLYKGQLLLWVRPNRNSVTIGGKTWEKRDLISIPINELGKPTPAVSLVFRSSAKETMQNGGEIQVSRDGVLAITYHKARGILSRLSFEDGRWTRERIYLPEYGTLTFAFSRGSQPVSSRIGLVQYESYLQPPVLYAVDVVSRKASLVRAKPAAFSASRFVTEQLWAVSRDGIRVPYFVVRPRSLMLNSKNPTLMHGYGSGGALTTPQYDGMLGQGWLEQGGVYVVANIRGGGELGPNWQVRGVGRKHTYEDFIAVAEDLIRRKITSTKHLGVQGFSMGGASSRSNTDNKARSI